MMAGIRSAGVYILHSPETNVLTLGVTVNIDERKGQHEHKHRTKFDLVHWQPCVSPRASYTLESKFLRRLKDLGLKPMENTREDFSTRFPEMFEDILIVDVLE